VRLLARPEYATFNHLTHDVHFYVQRTVKQKRTKYNRRYTTQYQQNGCLRYLREINSIIDLVYKQGSMTRQEQIWKEDELTRSRYR
jgi:hypothetical protein